jgi:hypothetical protein
MYPQHVSHQHVSHQHVSSLPFGCILDFSRYHHKRILRWACLVERMPMSQVPRQLLPCWVARPQHIWFPEMNTVSKHVPLCGALSSLQKPQHYMGIQQKPLLC